MTQPDLFQSFTRRGMSIVPPTADELLARKRRDRGIARAADHAGKEWQDKAVGYVRLHATVHAFLMAEDVKRMAEADGLEPPTDARAWGGVMRRAAREKIVRACGYAPANSSNRSAKVRWESLVAG